MLLIDGSAADSAKSTSKETPDFYHPPPVSSQDHNSPAFLLLFLTIYKPCNESINGKNAKYKYEMKINDITALYWCKIN